MEDQRQLRVFNVSHPVYQAKPQPTGALLIAGEIEGSAAYLGGDFFITAGHVVKTLCGSGRTGVIGLFDTAGDQKGVRVIDAEDLACDVGIVQVRFDVPEWRECAFALRWRSEPLSHFDQVRTIGYPYGLYHIGEQGSVVPRAFAGHVVANPAQFRLPTLASKAFKVYELSFPAPRGISGAPLLSAAGEIAIVGVVVGNSQSRMLILQSEEIECATNAKTITKEYESLALGIAVQAGEVLSLNSRILGMTVERYLRGQGRVA